jgi:hypothetical protein
VPAGVRQHGSFLLALSSCHVSAVLAEADNTAVHGSADIIGACAEMQGTSSGVSPTPGFINPAALEQSSGNVGFTNKQFGMMQYAASSFCAAMMVITARVASPVIPTWEIIFARSVVLAAYSLWRLTTSDHGFLGKQCELLLLF